MGRGKHLMNEELAVIKAYKDTGLSNREIAKKIKRSPKVVYNYFKIGVTYGAYKGSGGKCKIDNRTKRVIVRHAGAQHMTASQIRADLQLPVSVQRVRQILHEDPNTAWKKRKPKHTARHKEVRLQFAKEHMSWQEEWHQVLLSDEKKFNLVGPDGYQYYWHDLRKEKETQMSQLWWWKCYGLGGFFLCWKTSTGMDFNKNEFTDYIDLLEISLLEHGEELIGENFTFQLDNATIHNSKFKKAWFREKNIQVMECPACSPDLNPIENLWGILSRKVYENGKQFEYTLDLKTRIREAWIEISIETTPNLVTSMSSRIFEVIKNSGSNTKC